MEIDLLTSGAGFVSFGIFFIIHALSLRWSQPEKLLRSLGICIIVIAIVPLALMGILFVNKSVDMPVFGWLLASLLAVGITLLTSLFYVICILGPYETSVRMRLIREINKGGHKGIELPELLRRYNTETITNLRLRRLLFSGDVIEKDGLYWPGSSRNFFFLFDKITAIIKDWFNG